MLACWLAGWIEARRREGRKEEEGGKGAAGGEGEGASRRMESER